MQVSSGGTGEADSELSWISGEYWGKEVVVVKIQRGACILWYALSEYLSECLFSKPAVSTTHLRSPDSAQSNSSVSKGISCGF